MEAFMDKLLNRFLKYISFDTQSDDTVLKTPSTEKQKDLGRFLVDELHSLGVYNAYIDEYSYVYGDIKGTVNTKTVGLIAHLDTATELPGKVTNPNIIDYYHGETIHLSNNVSLNPNVFQNLNNVLGHKIVTTDGTTLLGGDDKAGIAIIMSTVEKLLQGNYNFVTVLLFRWLMINENLQWMKTPFAHRGLFDNVNVPENSILACEKAVERGLVWNLTFK